MMPALILLRGGGDLASGVALRLFRAGLNVVITELVQPLAVRRSVAFSESVYEQEVAVEGVVARAINDPTDTLKILSVIARKQIPVIVDPNCISAHTLHPFVIVDGRMTKHPPESLSHNSSLFLGLGPGFNAPTNCQAVIETQRGHTLGRVIWEGASLSDTSAPEGDPRRVLRAPIAGVLKSNAKIGERFELGQMIAEIGDQDISAPFSGVLRGLLHPGLTAFKGMKIGDLDPRDDPSICQLVSDKSLAVGGGVLEALLARPDIRNKLWG
jgi:xanthine dehydrogenase accessory factor